MIRKALREEIERATEKFLRIQKINLVEWTKEEIQEELKAIEIILRTKKAWEEFCASGKLPEDAKFEYETIFDSHHLKEEYEPDTTLLQEMVASSLLTDLYHIISTKYSHRNPGRIPLYVFIRVGVGFQKQRALWREVKFVMEPLEKTLAFREEFDQIPERLLQRLLEIPDDTHDSETQIRLLRPLGFLLETDPIPTRLTEAFLQSVKGNWSIEFYANVNNALERLKRMLSLLPDPNKIPCEQARRRIIELYESDPKAECINVQTLEDATIIDHIAIGCWRCNVLRPCVSSLLGYRVVRQWADRPKKYTEDAIKMAKLLQTSGVIKKSP